MARNGAADGRNALILDARQNAPGTLQAASDIFQTASDINTTGNMKKEISTKNAPFAAGPYSQGVKAGGMVFVSGQLPVDPQTGKFPGNDIAELTRCSLDNINAVLYEAGMTLRDVVKTTVFLTDMRDFDKMNEAFAGYFADIPPARSVVAVSRLPKGARIEIEAIAASD